MKTVVGAKIRLIHMEDPYPLPSGSMGTVLGVEGNGDLDVTWDNGSNLKLIPGVDEWEEIHETDSDLFSVPDSAHRPG